GKRLATAVPDVHTRATGFPPAFAIPSAEKPDDRSSRITCTRTPPWRARARAIGVDREPGDTHASVSPNRTSSSTRTDMHAYATSPAAGPSGTGALQEQVRGHPARPERPVRPGRQRFAGDVLGQQHGRPD